MAKLLVVDDDSALLTMVRDWLEDEGFIVETAAQGDEAEQLLLQFDYDAVVLDWDLPGKSGIDVLKSLRENEKLTPVLMLTGKDHIDEKVEGLESGADDYLTKPFHVKELSSRVRSLLRRTAGSATNTLKYRNICLDPGSFKVTVDGKLVSLHSREFALLEYFMRHPGQVFNADSLLDKVWKSDSAVGPETVRQCVKRIRNKVDKKGADSIIENIYGVGYRLKEE